MGRRWNGGGSIGNCERSQRRHLRLKSEGGVIVDEYFHKVTKKGSL